MTLKVCSGCKKPFLPTGQERNGGNAGSCSAKCANKVMRKQYPDYIKRKICKSCGETKEIKQFGYCGAGKYATKENCLKCSPSAESHNVGTSKRFKNKSDYVEIVPAYIQTIPELTRSVLFVTDQEQIDVDIED